MELYEPVVEEATDKIRLDKENEFLDIAIEVESFVNDNNVPISEFFVEEDYYHIRCYPDKNFIDFVKNINIKLIPLLKNIKDGDYKLDIYINNYIVRLLYNYKPILTATNIFYPIRNDKFSIESYKGRSRFDIGKKSHKTISVSFMSFIMSNRSNRSNKQIHTKKILYIHPKYILEPILDNIYNPSKDTDEEMESFDVVMRRWNKIGYSPSNITAKKDRLGISEFDLIKSKAYRCEIDLQHTNCIGSEEDTEWFINKLKQYSYSVNQPKSIYEPRLKNIIFKNNEGKIIIKIWFITSYELIPIIPDGRTHIDVNIRLLLSDHIIYKTLGIDPIANFKLSLFDKYLKKKQELINCGVYHPLENCKYIGTYYDIESHLRSVRIDNIIKMIKRMKKN